MNIYTKTDIGLCRTENQDCVWGELIAPGVGAAVLCDGMGGEREGGLASKIAVETISKRIKENFNIKMSKNSVRNLLVTAVGAANSLVWDTARATIHEVMGTTCVAVIVFGGTAYIVNVGDSRAYHLFLRDDDECIRQITKDHTHIRDLLDKGLITEEQVKTHPDRHVITRAIGAEESVTSDYFELSLEPGDKILLCSDGLSAYGDDMDILEICFDNEQNICCDKLIEYALTNGGQDNVSVALIAP